jgi:hypothetical protein
VKCAIIAEKTSLACHLETMWHICTVVLQKKIPKKFVFAAVALLSNCTNIDLLEHLQNPGGKFTSSCGSDCRIFVTGNTYVGNMGGVAGADGFCNGDPARPQTTNPWKAVLGSTPERTACTSPACTVGGAVENFNWVLKPNATYRRPDGALIGTTSGSAIFSFPLQVTTGSVGQFVWTGMDTSWAPSGSCTNWKVADSSLAATGDAGSTGASAIFTTNSLCSSAQRIYCAEQ